MRAPRRSVATVPPNTQWKYSNLAYQLLGEIVTRASGKPYDKVVQTRLLTPLKLTATAFDPKAALAGRKATGYDPRFLSDVARACAGPDPEHKVFEAEGGLWSCVEDLGRWLSFQFGDGRRRGGGSSPRRRLAEMHKPRYLVDEKWTRAWAIGWYAVRQDDTIWIMHSGGHYGFITNACFDPKEKIGAIALVNGIGSPRSWRWSSAGSRARPFKGRRAEDRASEAAPAKWRPSSAST